jgi:phosphate transport system substrate-binding protein
VAEGWATAFSALYPEAEITLTSVGSGAAMSALWGDIDCDTKPVQALCSDDASSMNDELGSTIWGLGDAPIGDHIYPEHPLLRLQQLPACAGAALVVYSNDVTGSLLERDNEDSALRLSFDVIAGIFNSSIPMWDDPKINEINPHLILPHEPISVVVRSDKSGQSAIFTEAIQFNVPEWPKEAVGSLPQWRLSDLAPVRDYSPSCHNNETSITPDQRLHFKADGKQGVALGILRIPYSIGYIELGYYSELLDFISQAHVSTKTYPTNFTAATNDSIRRTMDSLSEELDDTTLGVHLDDYEQVEGGFPITGFAYWYVSKSPTVYQDCYQAWLLCKFIEWSYTDLYASEIAMASGWITPPQSMVELALQKLKEVQCLDDETGTVISALRYIPEKYQVNMHHIDKTRPVVWSLASIVVATSLAFIGWVLYNHTHRVVRASQPG